MYEPSVTRLASARLARRREAKERRRFALERELYARSPRLRELDRALRGTMADLAQLATGGRPIAPNGPELAAIRERNQALQAERAALLRELGVDPAELDGAPDCPLCGDSGWTGGQMCSCLKALCAEEQMKSLTALLGLTEEQSFDKLRLDIYSDRPWNGRKMSPREQMGQVVAVCEGFAKQFPGYPLKNLLLSGGTGLGKTFLSGCVAREVSSRGYSVVYDTAVNLFSVFETRRFTRDADEGREARDVTRRYLGCDLLILDDLGSEFTTPLVQASLYEVVNSRLQADKHTIISTNLSREQIAERYTPQLASRLAGTYRMLVFYGDDLRRPQ